MSGGEREAAIGSGAQRLAGRRGVRLGVDYGRLRIGVAASDPEGLLATPVGTLRHGRDGAELAELAGLAAERDCLEVIVGLPRSLSGRAGPAERLVRQWAGRLAAAVAPRPVRLVDERWSTVSAAARLAAAGIRGRVARRRVDAAAATVILQAALDAERSTGRPTGELVAEASGSD
jgi:putative Holliday junction resolvase